jgi:hypothetical protein
MHIPSNFSLEEALKFATLPEIVLDKIETYIIDKNNIEARLERSFKDYEVLEEQLNFCRDYISELLEYSKTATKAKDLKEYIVNKYENSYIEL